MEKVTYGKKGTARYLHSPGSYMIAGNTGTDQVFSYSQGKEPRAKNLPAHLRDHSWFMAFAPSKNPRIAIAIIVEHDRGSAQIAKNIIDEYLRQENK